MPDVELVKTVFNYGTPAALLFFSLLGVYLTLRRIGAFLGPIVKSVAEKHVATMDAMETIGQGLLEQQKAQTELMARHDGTLADHSQMLGEIHKAVVKPIVVLLACCSSLLGQCVGPHCPRGAGMGIGVYLGPACPDPRPFRGAPVPDPRFAPAVIIPAHDPQSVVRFLPDGVFSGVVVHPDGLILTAKHCMDSPATVSIQGTTYKTEVVFIPPVTEGAVALLVEAHGLPFSVVAEKIEPLSQPVYCAGYPAGAKTPMITFGETHGSNWFLRDGTVLNRSSKDVAGAFQANEVDFASAGGQSGGPLYDRHSQVIGLCSGSDGHTSQFISWRLTRQAYEAGLAVLKSRQPAEKPIALPAPDKFSVDPPPFKRQDFDELRKRLESLPDAIAEKIPQPPELDHGKIADAVSRGNGDLIHKLGQVAGQIEKIEPAIQALKIAAPTGPVGLGVGAALFGLSLLRKKRPAYPSGPAIDTHQVQVMSHPGSEPIPQSVVTHQITPNALQTAPPQLVAVATRSEELDLLHEAMAHVAKQSTQSASVIQQIESAAKQLKTKTPTF